MEAYLRIRGIVKIADDSLSGRESKPRQADADPRRDPSTRDQMTNVANMFVILLSYA